MKWHRWIREGLPTHPDQWLLPDFVSLVVCDKSLTVVGLEF